MSDTDTIKVLLDTLTGTLSQFSSKLDAVMGAEQRQEQHWEEMRRTLNESLDVLKVLRRDLEGENVNDLGLIGDITKIKTDLGPISKFSEVIRQPIGIITIIIALLGTILGLRELYDKVKTWKAPASQVGPTQPAQPTADSTPPEAPANLTTHALSSHVVHLSWSASKDFGGNVAWYRIWRDGMIVGQSPTTDYADDTALSKSKYCYNVQAMDTTGNLSVLSAQTCVTMP